MKQIIFINSNKAWGGGEKWHFNMARALAANGHRCRLITNNESELGDRADQAGLEIDRLGISRMSFLNPCTILAMYRLLKKSNSPNIIANLPSDIKLCIMAAKAAGAKKIIYRRGMPRDLKPTLLNKFIFSRVDIFIANSEEIKRTITRYFPELEKKTTIIFNGVHPLEQVNKTENKIFTLGNLGRLVDQKGQQHLIRIAKILKERNFNFKLLIGGSGPRRQKLQQLIKQNDLESCVNLIGLVPSEKFFPGIDLFLLTSHFEGTANALIEALQYQVPAIAFDISSNSEVIGNGVAGYLIPPFDEAEFADRIIRLAGDREDYEKLQKNGKALIVEKFDYSQKVSEVERLLQ